MANGDFVSWDYMREHEQKADDGFQRLTTVEVEMKQAKEILQENKVEIKALQKTVWTASGMAVVIMIVVELILKNLH